MWVEEKWVDRWMEGRKEEKEEEREKERGKGVERGGREEKESWPQAYLFPITSNCKGKNIKSLPHTHNHNICNLLKDLGILIYLHLKSINNF